MSRLPERYPDVAGFKAPGPSEQAANAISGTAKTLRDQVLKTFADAPAGLSADAVADRLGKSVLSSRRNPADDTAGQERKRDERHHLGAIATTAGPGS
jgi:hypothetical protein